jgi:hypothetical protein
MPLQPVGALQAEEDNNSWMEEEWDAQESEVNLCVLIGYPALGPSCDKLVTRSIKLAGQD